ncbi:hypothetical protein B0H14DRAFT_3431293 [Mycena olivaceomarginata]|nr:hypothetical protein B0H14DRAFT_3431293 [Mycena olivaceomarginata]
MARLIWYHVPLRLTLPGAEMGNVTAEKRMALNLVDVFAVALKHHLRGELGIYYEDLYNLVRPLHDFFIPLLLSFPLLPFVSARGAGQAHCRWPR